MASKQLKRILTAGIFPLLVLASCISEKEIYPRSGDGDTEITFSIMLPGKSAPATRGMEERDENEVAYMDILAFEPGGTYVYTARCSGSEIMTDGGNMRKKSFTVKLRQGTFDLVLLANAREQTVSGGSFAGMDKAAVLALIEAEVSGKWPADGSRPIPMWGEKGGVVINESTDLKDEKGVSLARMIARVDVQITGTAANTFKLSSVYVYNYNTHGSIAPLSGQWNTTDPDAPKATAPNVPASSVLTKGPLEYSGSPVVTATGCASEIYIFEAENHTTSAHEVGNPQLSRTCLVIGGVYDANENGIFTDDGDPTYYRVDFSTGLGVSQKFLDVLRNHQYIFSITKVSGAGYESSQVAFESLPVNIEANVLQWNEAEFSEIKFDGQYMLGISPASVFDFFKSSETQTANIKTTYPDGWKVLKITQDDGVTPPIGDWLTTDKTTGTLHGSDGIYTSLGISVDENTTGSDRTGYIYIQAGKLETRLTVKQTTSVPSLLVTLDANDNPVDALEFSGPVGVSLSPQAFKVQWAPKNETLYISTSPVAMPETGSYTPISWFSYLTESGEINNTGADVYVTPISNGSGYAEFTIQPNAITSTEMGGDPFYERAIQVDFRATGGQGLLRKGLLLQQYVYNMQADAESFHLADGSKYTFNVKSNRPWKAYLIDDGDGMVESPAVSTTAPIATGGYNLPNGVNVEFKTFDDLSNPTIFTGTAKVRVEWLKGEDPSDDADWDKSTVVDLFCGSGNIESLSNCYIVSDNIPILIPVKRANGYRNDGTRELNWLTAMGADADQVAGDFSVELLWSDTRGNNSTGMDEDGSTPVRLLRAVGSGENGYVLVQAGNVQGNAVVAAKVGSNIVWSWHIWVTDYAPSGIWMDRNLGALTNTLNVITSYGFYYQWGRKDPIPGPAALTGTAGAAYYDMTTTAKTAITVLAGAVLKTSIQSPTAMLGTWVGSNGNNSWAANQNAAAGTGDKTIYDPCPDGWQVPIRRTLAYNNASNTRHWGQEAATIGPPTHFGGTWIRGISWPDKGGNYPAGGFRSAAGTISSLGTEGYHQCATAYQASTLYGFMITTTGISPCNLTTAKANGFFVRCVAIE